MTDNPQPPNPEEIKKLADSQKRGQPHRSERQATRIDRQQQKPDVSAADRSQPHRSERQAARTDNQAKPPSDVSGRGQPHRSERQAARTDNQQKQVSEKPVTDRPQKPTSDDLKIALSFGNPEVKEKLKATFEDIRKNAAKDPVTYLEVGKWVDRLYVRHDQFPASRGYDYVIDKTFLQGQGYSDVAISTLDNIFHETGYAPRGVQRDDYLIRGSEGEGKLIRNVTDAQAESIQRKEDFIHDQQIKQQAAEMLAGLLIGIAGIVEGKQQFQSVVHSPENARRITNEIVDKRQGITGRAEQVFNEVKVQSGPVVLNLGGNGEVAGAINLNPQIDQHNRSAPYLIEARAEQMASLFPANSIDKIVSNDMVRGQIEWTIAAQGAFRVLKSGGEVSIAPYAGSLAAHLTEIKSAFQAAGFRDVEVKHDRIVTAIKP